MSGKVVWISGASSGIGEHIAYQLASVGCKLILSGDLQSVNNVKCSCWALPGVEKDNIFALEPFDIRDIVVHQGMVQKAFEHFGRVDVLINNVGRTQRAQVLDIPHDTEREIFDINLLGQVNLTKLVLARFVEQETGGHIAVTASVAGKFGAPFSATYTASKHALIGYFECLRVEYFAKGVTVTVACPGPVKSNLLSRAFYSGNFKREINETPAMVLETDRCAYLICVAIANKLDEVWISLKPILWLVYLSQYFPSLFKTFYCRLATPERAIRMREGRHYKQP